jgi:hypothetical protein
MVAESIQRGNIPVFRSIASPKDWVIPCVRETQHILNGISSALPPPNLTTVIAKLSWTAAVRHAGESARTQGHAKCLPGDMLCDEAVFNLTSLQEEAFYFQPGFSVNTSSERGFAEQLASKSQAAWQYLQSSACTANAMEPSYNMQYNIGTTMRAGVLMPQANLTHLNENQELGMVIFRRSQGFGDGVPWFIPDQLGLAVAALVAGACFIYWVERMRFHERQLLPTTYTDMPLADDILYDGDVRRWLDNNIPNCGANASHHALPSETDPHGIASQISSYVDNCCYVLVVLIITSHALDCGLAQAATVVSSNAASLQIAMSSPPGPDPVPERIWWHQAIHNYCESFAPMMLAVCIGVRVRSATQAATKRFVAQVAAILGALSLALMVLSSTPDTKGLVWGLQNHDPSLGIKSFLEAWLVWLLLTHGFRMVRPAVLLLAAYVTSWVAGYWFSADVPALHVETALSFLPFYVTGLITPVEWVVTLNHQTITIVGSVVTVLAISAHLLMSFRVAFDETGREHNMHFNAWQMAASRHSYFNSDMSSVQSQMKFWLAWTQRMSHQLLICWPSGLALLAMIPHSRTVFTELGSRFIYPLAGHVFSLWVVFAWYRARVSHVPIFSGSAIWSVALLAISNLIYVKWTSSSCPLHGWAQMVLEPKWIYNAFAEDDQDSVETTTEGEGKLPFSFYVAKAFHTSPPPVSPTWLYTASRAAGQGTALRATFCFCLVTPFVYFCWCRANYMMEHVFGFKGLFALAALELGQVIVINWMSPWPAREETYHHNNPDYLAKIGCIVPCHKSAAEIGATVRSLLFHLKPEQIVVVDNGNSIEPLDDTAEAVKEIDPRVQYIWVPIGMKTNALWMGLHALPPSVEFVMHIDDDTVVPPDMVFDEHVWDNARTDALSYGITMYQTGAVEKCVDLEFKMISQLRLFQSDFSTVWFQHGIIGIWRRQAFFEVLQEHPCLPFGEDNWNGTINLLRNRQMRQELRSVVSTYAPPVLFPSRFSRSQGYGAANVWKQRAERWFVNAPRRFLMRFYLLLFYKHDTLRGNIWFRVASIGHLLEVGAHLSTPFAAVAYIFSPRFDWSFGFYAFLILAVKGILEACLQNYVFWRHRPDIQVDPKICLLWPFYRWFLQICFWYGHWRCLLYYIPFFPFRHGLYTEGGMTPELLRHIHGVETAPESASERSTRGCSGGLGLEDGCTGMGTTSAHHQAGLGTSFCNQAQACWIGEPVKGEVLEIQETDKTSDALENSNFLMDGSGGSKMLLIDAGGQESSSGSKPLLVDTDGLEPKDVSSEPKVLVEADEPSWEDLTEAEAGEQPRTPL